MNIYDYADAMNLEIEITRWPNQANRWSAKFRGVHTLEHPEAGTMTGTYGDGTTPLAAVRVYSDKISGQYLHIGRNIGMNRDNVSILRCPTFTGPIT